MQLVELAALAAVFACSFGAPAAAQPVESVYTPLDLDKCRLTPGRDVEDYGSWHCRGYAGIPVFVAAGDQRIFVSFGRNARNEPAAKQTLAAFSSEGNAIEWRLTRGAGDRRVPFAAIMRWHTTVSGGDRPVEGQVLVVTRLGPGAVCHVGYVDGRSNTDANILARRIADEHARNFRCGIDKAIVLGNTGAGFSRPYGN